MRSIWRNITDRASLRGGSTITQQLVKNRLLSSEKSYSRKFRELILAMQVEMEFSKDQILEMYLNTIAFGGVTYGVEEASQLFFEKPASELNIAESALLAGLPQAPSRYDPLGKDPKLSHIRMRQVLSRMREEKFISDKEYNEAKDTTFVFKNKEIPIKAPHFVMYVKQLLLKMFTKKQLYEEGLLIKTTLDLKLHNQVQKVVTDNVNRLFRLWVGNGAALVTNPKTGEILSMVGGKDYFDKNNEGNVNVALSLRQPGSSIKPLTYAMSIESGKTPRSRLIDAPVSLYADDGTLYSPRNDDHIFRGNVSLREALASSFNLPAVRELKQLGVLKYIEKAKTMGINSWNNKTKSDFGLTLGSGEVRMIDMARLYSTFANAGFDVPLRSLLEIKDYNGQMLYQNNCVVMKAACKNERKFSQKTTAFLTDILIDNSARFRTFGTKSDLYIPNHQVAVKTGTTNHTRDNWTIGYTSDYVAAVWIGNNKNTPMRFIHSGANGASTIWKKIMALVLDEKKPHVFKLPKNIIKVSICKATGTLPCDRCLKIIKEIFVKGTEPTESCAGYIPMSMD